MSEIALQMNCPECRRRNLTVLPFKDYRLHIPQLASSFQRQFELYCGACQKVVARHEFLIDANGNLLSSPLSMPLSAPMVNEATRAINTQFIRDVQDISYLLSIQFPSVLDEDGEVLFPANEGTIQDGTSVDRYGRPDLMAGSAEEYLRQFNVLMPREQLPARLIEIMPALLILVTATELAIKAYLIRSDKHQKGNHSLSKLFNQLDTEQIARIEESFACLEICSKLTALGENAPRVIDILELYSSTYGDVSNVYMDCRYYAEPTSNFRKSSSLHGETLLKPHTPYPIFLPEVVKVLIDNYWFFSGPERLRRLGADIRSDSSPPRYSESRTWGLIPASLGLIVIVMPQRAAKGPDGKELDKFQNFRQRHPTGFTANWGYGGDTLLFYRAGGNQISSGVTTGQGLEYKIYDSERLSMRSRDMYLLADALNQADNGSDVLGLLSPLKSAD
ncbi:MAG: hypothetical protein OXO50_06495 [Caldilineaceae bacterium]|nr:hypothetical protein [Caldilineaceae bacterium]